MTHYFFQLGRDPELSTAEIRAVFSLAQTIPLHAIQKDNLLLVETKGPIDPAAWMERLGGTIKIGRQVENKDGVLLCATAHLRETQPQGKIVFSLADRTLAKQIKRALSSEGRSVRYIEPKNTATILHNSLIERQGDLTMIGKDLFVTEAIQPIEALGERDFGRPGRDAKSGMLPPKLAQIMLNLAEQPPDSVILDPFCGSGTLLMEALLMGYTRLIGSDISPRAVADTKKNIVWIQDKKNPSLPLPKDIRLFEADVRHLAKHIPRGSIQAIVTEPYLGVPLRGQETKKFLEAEAERLAVLYRASAEALLPLLAPHGVFISAVPALRHQSGWVRIPVRAAFEALGFHTMPLSAKTPQLFYARPNQHVGREIWKWRV